MRWSHVQSSAEGGSANGDNAALIEQDQMLNEPPRSSWDESCTGCWRPTKNRSPALLSHAREFFPHGSTVKATVGSRQP